MKTSVEELEDNKVKLSVQVEEPEFEKAVDAAFRKIAREVNIPGFRPGKAPRRILEKRLGEGVARGEALRDAIPEYYAQAVRDNDVDVIAAPEIDITEGEEDGPVAFEAVVEVRPVVVVPGYESLRVDHRRTGGHRGGDRRPDPAHARPARRAGHGRPARRRGRLRHHRHRGLPGRRAARGAHRPGLLLRGRQRRHRGRARRGPHRRVGGRRARLRRRAPRPRRGGPALRGLRQGGQGAGAARARRRVGGRGLRVRHHRRAARRPRQPHDRGAQDAGPDVAAREGQRRAGRAGRRRGARGARQPRDAAAPAGLRHAPAGAGPHPRPVARQLGSGPGRVRRDAPHHRGPVGQVRPRPAGRRRGREHRGHRRRPRGRVRQGRRAAQARPRRGAQAVRRGRPDLPDRGRHPPAQGPRLPRVDGRDRRRGRQPDRSGRPRDRPTDDDDSEAQAVDAASVEEPTDDAGAADTDSEHEEGNE